MIGGKLGRYLIFIVSEHARREAPTLVRSAALLTLAPMHVPTEARNATCSIAIASPIIVRLDSASSYEGIIATSVAHQVNNLIARRSTELLLLRPATVLRVLTALAAPTNTGPIMQATRPARLHPEQSIVQRRVNRLARSIRRSRLVRLVRGELAELEPSGRLNRSLMMLVLLALLGRHHEVVRVPLLLLLLKMVALLQLLFLGMVSLWGLRLGLVEPCGLGRGSDMSVVATATR